MRHHGLALDLPRMRRVEEVARQRHGGAVVRAEPALESIESKL